MFGKSWLTTLIGVVGAVMQLAIAYATTGSITADQITAAMSTFAIGLGAKSFNVTGPPQNMSTAPEPARIVYPTKM